jgi:hypothetical protein
MEASAYSTLAGQYPPSPPVDDEVALTTGFSYRNSQETAHAKTIISNTEAFLLEAQDILALYKQGCAELSEELRTLKLQAVQQIEGVVPDKQTELNDLAEELRVRFVQQHEENVRLRNQLSVLQRERAALEVQSLEEGERLSHLEQNFAL